MPPPKVGSYVQFLGALRDNGWSYTKTDGDMRVYDRGKESLRLKFGHNPLRVIVGEYSDGNTLEKLSKKDLAKTVVEIIVAPKLR